MNKPKLWTKEFIIIAFINFLVAINFYLLMVVISGFAMNKFDSSPSEAGFTASIFIIGALFARMFAGKWIVRIGYKKILCMGLIASLVMTFLYFGVNSVISLLTVRFLHGAAFGIITTATGTIVANIIPKGRSGEGIGYYGLSTTLATAIGPFWGIFLSRHGSFSMIFASCAITLVISLLISPFFSLPKMELTEEQLEEMKGFKFNNFFEANVIPIATVSMLIFICYSSIVSFLSVYSQEIHLVDAASFFFIVYAAVILISRPVIGRLFDLKGENSIMYSAILIFIIGIILFSQAHHGFVLLLAGALLGLSIGAIQSSTQAISVKITPHYRMGLAHSTYFMLADIGMGIGPLLAGLVIPFTDYREMYMGMAIVGAGCLLLYYFVHGRKQHSLRDLSV